MKTVEFPFYDDPKQQIESDYDTEAVKMLSELAQVFAELKKEGAIVSPVRCKWEPAQK